MLRIINCCQNAQIYASALLNPRLVASPSYQFAKLKKEKTKLHVPTINISKFDKKMDGFILYENRQGGMFKFITLCFIGYFMWGYWTYSQIEDEEIKVNYLIMGALMVIPFLIFQFRVVKTLKSMVLDKAGENVVMTRFQSGGFGR